MKLFALATLLVVAVLGAQIAAGGGDFTPREPTPACVKQPARAPVSGLEALAERVVVDGVAAAACELGVSRERLVLDIGTGGEVDAEVLRDGLDRAVAEAEELPPVSSLVDEALGLTDLPGIAQDAIRAVPDGIIDELLPTEELLRRAIAGLDVEAVLADLDEPEAALRDALLEAVGDQAVASLEDLLP